MKILILAISDGRHADNILFNSRFYNTVYVSLIDNVGRIAWYFSRVLYRLNLYQLYAMFFGYVIQKKVSLAQFDYIFINEGDCTECLIDYLLPRSNAKIVFQYWNTIDKTCGVLPGLIHQYKNNPRVRFQTFDYQDVKKYNLCYNYQFAPYIAIHAPSSLKKKRVALFVGVDKNRLAKIREVVEALKQIEISSKLYIFPDEGKTYSEKEKKYLYHGTKFAYTDIVNMVAEVDIIIDIAQDNQNGITWRPLEALFYQKKLITNFDEIIKYDFYTPENIFIIGKDDISSLRSFLDCPLNPISEEIKEEYTFDGCMKYVISEFEDSLYSVNIPTSESHPISS